MADLISTANYKIYKNITNTTDDSIIDILVTSVSSLVKAYCGISFIDYYATDKTEYFDILDPNINCVFLDENPIVSITSVKERESQSSSYVELFTAGTNDKYDYVIKTDIGVIQRTTSTSSKYFPIGFEAVEIVYKSGYFSTPEDLKLALYDMVTYYLKQEYKERKSIINSSIVSKSSTSISNDVGFPDHITRVLDLYKVNV